MSNNALVKKVYAYAGEWGMLPRGSVVLAAVSGGADSMCLLQLLTQLSGQLNLTLHAATFDHRIRPEGAADAAFVLRWCEKQGIPCHTGSKDVPQWAAEHHMGLEEAARACRYRFLEQAAERIGASRIATAHNANDNAETMLLHLIRGTGARGLSGIPPVRGQLIRPLLAVSRAEIEAYLAENGIPHVEDATNQDIRYDRNYLRHQVLPLLTAQNPNLLTGLRRTAESLRQDNDCLEQLARSVTAQAVCRLDSVSIPVAILNDLPEAVFHRAVQQLTERVPSLPPETVLSGANRRSIRALCRSSQPGAACPLTGGLTARRVYDRLELTLCQEEPPPEGGLLVPGQTLRFGNRLLTCEEAICPEGRFNQPDEYYISGSVPLTVRSRRPGDSITLPARNRKTVKKLLLDSKIPRHLRDSIAVLEANGAVAAVDHFGCDQAFLPRPGDCCRKITGKPIPPEPPESES